MAIIKWDPLGNIATLQDRINRLFDDSFPCQTDEKGQAPQCDWTPNVDIYETDRRVVIAVDLPGVDKDSVAVEVKDNVLAISGERHAESIPDGASFYRRERPSGLFLRTFTLHALVHPESIKAKFKKGVLTVEIPKPEEETPRQINVSIE
jgi:HSP20 family protein